MNTEMKSIIPYIENAYRYSNYERSDFFDVFLSIIAWQVLSKNVSSEFVMFTDQRRHLFDSYTQKNKAEVNAKEINETLLTWEKLLEQQYNKSFAGFLTLEKNLTPKLLDNTWPVFLQLWENYFSIGNDLYEKLEDLLQYVESAVVDGKREILHIVPKSLANAMACYLSEGKSLSSVYDPFSVSGGLLLELIKQTPDVVKTRGIAPNKFSWKLTNLRLLLYHNPIQIEILAYSYPQYLKKFDGVICNPPYGGKYFQPLSLPVDEKWAKLIASSARLDIAYLCHILSSLTSQGRAAILLPNIFLSGGAIIKDILAKIIEENILDAVIELPQGIFTHTNIAPTLFCFNKNRNKTERIFLSSAPKCFEKNGKQVTIDSERLISLIKEINDATKHKLLGETVSCDDVISSNYSLQQLMNRESILKTRQPSNMIMKECQKLELDIKKAKQKIEMLITTFDIN